METAPTTEEKKMLSISEDMFAKDLICRRALSESQLRMLEPSALLPDPYFCTISLHKLTTGLKPLLTLSQVFGRHCVSDPVPAQTRSF